MGHREPGSLCHINSAWMLNMVFNFSLEEPSQARAELSSSRSTLTFNGSFLNIHLLNEATTVIIII